MNITPLQKEQIKKTRILIVDDLPENLQVLGNTLREYGFQIAFAVNGAQAITIATLKLPHLILLDMSMPEMDGLNVCKKLKENSLTRTIPIVFLTARTETDNIMKALKTGAVDYVVKPFNTLELIQRIMLHLGIDRLAAVDDPGTLKITNEELRSLLEGEFMVKWKDVQLGLFIDEIVEFSKSLKEIGEKSESKVLMDYCDDLYQNADQLNIEKMTKILKQYPSLVLKIVS